MTFVPFGEGRRVGGASRGRSVPLVNELRVRLCKATASVGKHCSIPPKPLHIGRRDCGPLQGGRLMECCGFGQGRPGGVYNAPCNVRSQAIYSIPPSACHRETGPWPASEADVWWSVGKCS